MKNCVRCNKTFDARGKAGKAFCTKECARAARGSEFRKNRQRALIRDNGQCRQCGSTKKVQVHHIVFLSQSGTNELSNLICLCADPCHLAAHGKKSRKSKEGRVHESKIEIASVGGSNYAKAA